MIGLHFFLAHTVSDYSFINPMKLKGSGDIKKWTKHVIFVVLVFLAFGFDTLFNSPLGIISFFAALAFHFAIDYLRFKDKSDKLIELVSLLGFLVFALIFSGQFSNSYITPIFALYLIGMITASVIPTQMFRIFGIIDVKDNESDGISERLAMFIFVFSGSIWLGVLAAVAGLIYRLIFRKKFSKLWVLSPIIGFIIPLIFKAIIK